MDDIKQHDDFPPLTIDQIRDLATAVREDFGGNLSHIAFTENLLMLLEDIPGFEADDGADARLIESAWATYSGRPPNS
ncbi:MULTISPECIES: hypothetical protein [Burkholderia cepacia complex]|uniref:hypothetical protein n=1 Tax=Burkholderia cepacia complex TaxID=87882 RepID=UPI001C22AC87|nr:hypothetical protein [Burkholderia multivorans]MBU9692320.1 hypothetical protein [Burkholderia multivorans]